ncbi:hypothetical protein AAFF_G00432380 [Aldrovandia affinis]|uniref:Uncharacterized protein n=1 Tax=Aldrovandia affinis TaxID=143900 RepID=A0AAD7S8D0_9TELE|nr:hypothetical protein AAFF_G00432380 [Aldrovandia affinis]
MIHRGPPDRPLARSKALWQCRGCLQREHHVTNCDVILSHALTGNEWREQCRAERMSLLMNAMDRHLFQNLRVPSDDNSIEQ